MQTAQGMEDIIGIQTREPWGGNVPQGTVAAATDPYIAAAM
jgi:hypothetical protein